MIDRLQKIFEEISGNHDLVLTPNTKVKKELGLSSFSLIQLICAIEDEFDVEVPNSQINKFKTVKDVVKFLEKTVENN